MNRFDRITSILVQLQSKRVVKAQELAERFQVSLRTIYRDIRSLEEAGIPIFGEAGSGYSLVDGYRLPPVMFTKEEATSLVAAEKVMEKFSDSVIQKNFESFLFKVKSVLKSTEKDLIENLEGQIQVRDKSKSSRQVNNALDVIFQAIAEEKAVELVYTAFGKEDETKRLVEPIGVYHEFDKWYTIAYCQLRKDYRNFRIDRMQGIFLTQLKRQAKRMSMKEYEEAQDKDPNKTAITMEKAVIRVEKPFALYLKERKYQFGFVSEIDYKDYVEMTFLTAYLENGFARWYLMFADHAQIIEPLSLKNRVKELLQKIEKNLG